MNLIFLDETDSTNSWLARNESNLPSGSMVIARRQTAGRGQRGNYWESEAGKNLTFSILLRPDSFPVVRQFHISEAFALAVCDALKEFCGVEACVKWPNDIYCSDKKICGILIEHSVGSKHIIRTIAGAGINLNQTEFLSDAPNPISVKGITGNDTDIDSFASRLAEIIERRLSSLDSEEGKAEVHREFRSRMWRGDEAYYPFRDVATGCIFNGMIRDVEPMGYLQITPDDEVCGLEKSPAMQADGSLRYAFKEVEFLL